MRGALGTDRFKWPTTGNRLGTDREHWEHLVNPLVDTSIQAWCPDVLDIGSSLAFVGIARHGFYPSDSTAPEVC